GEIRDIRIVRFDGQAWTPPRPVHADGWHFAGCPVNGPAVAAQGPRVWVAWYTEAGGWPELRAAVSQDGGDSFAAPVTLVRGPRRRRVAHAGGRRGRRAGVDGGGGRHPGAARRGRALKRGQAYCILRVMPPSTMNSCAVVKPDSAGASRWTASAAMSSGVPTRPAGCWAWSRRDSFGRRRRAGAC